MAFFLESTFVGLFFFGWDRMSRVGHLTVTWLVAIGSNLSALWILIANGWMQNPVGAHFNVDTMRMELTSFTEILFNPVAQAKFVHTVSAGYVTGAVFVLAISSWYLLKGRHPQFARRSFTVAASFGLAASLSVVVLGDESGYTVTEHQKMKLAAIEAMWETEPAPAGFTLFGLPDQEAQDTAAEIKIPFALGLIATRSLDEELPGIKALVSDNAERIRDGLIAYDALQRLRADRADPAAKATLAAHQDTLGYALLLKKYVDDPRQASPAQIAEAALDTVPHVPSLFWSFRLMVALGFGFILLFALAFWQASRRDFSRRGLQTVALFALPTPWIAAELGWFVAEHGRQPWSIEGILPTFLSASSVSGGQVLFTLGGFVLFYSTLAVVDVFLMVRYVRMGPAQALDIPPAAARAALDPAE
jgi:cytochrome d ubiquinol oxidase subunit I